VSISGFGPDGPYASQPAYDLVIQGLVGAMPIQGGDGPPVMMKSLVADKCTALTAASAAMSALLARERNGGRGQHVEVPMLDAFAAYLLPDLLVQESFQPKDPNPGPRLDIHRTWETADGHVVGIVIEDAQFQGVCRALERSDLLEDERFASFIGRIQHAQELFGTFEAELRKWPTREFIARAREHGAPFAPANDLDDFLSDPQVRHNRTWQDWEAPGSGTTRYLRHPVRYAETPASLRRHPPRLGEHTDELLAEAGFEAAEIRAGRESGVIG
jgi:crotonobetainyl-CoA:carnitine CoA-transferase CaiB-like acyl-CoA transferase